MPQQHTSTDLIPSAIIVWVTLAFCLLAWRCNMEDFTSAADKARQEERLRTAEEELKSLKEVDRDLERRLQRVEKGDFNVRLGIAESKLRVLESRRP